MLSDATQSSASIRRTGSNGASRRISPIVRPASPVSRQLAALLTQAARHWVMIAKTFIMAKLFRAPSTNFLRQDKSLRANGGP